MRNKKNAGVSLIIAMSASLFVLTVTTFALISLGRSFNEAAKVERFTRGFYSLESGLEAGLYHHNARGQGVNLNNPAQATNQTINFTNAPDTTWTVTGRAPVLVGLLKENQSVYVPLTIDHSESIENVPSSPDNAWINGIHRIDFQIYQKTKNDPEHADDILPYLRRSIDESYKNPIAVCENKISELENKSNFFKDIDNCEAYVDFLERFGEVAIPNGFQFDADKNLPDGSIDLVNTTALIDWNIARKKDGEPTQTLIPKPATLSYPCVRNAGEKSTFICSAANGTWGTPQKLSDLSIIVPGGLVSPGAKDLNIADHGSNDINGFVQDTAYKLEGIGFRALFSTTDAGDGETKIAGIPYVLKLKNSTGGNVDIPLPYFRITAQTNSREFGQVLNLIIPERQKNTAFDYVIFD